MAPLKSSTETQHSQAGSTTRQLQRGVYPGLLALLVAAAGLLQTPPATAQPPPTIGQVGKDVPWVPTPDELVNTMLGMAAVTPEDLVIDLGSGDGRTVIAAARLGARAIGVELEPGLVELSRRRAREAGVAELTEFVETDLFDYDISPATVITMFLLPELNYRLRPTLFTLEPGTRIVSNTWDLRGEKDNPDALGWRADEVVVLDPCPTWCTSLLWIVPARVQGAWRLGPGELRLDQQFQMLTGSLRVDGRTMPIEVGRLRGTEISFRVGATSYTGRVRGTTMTGVARTPNGAVDWNATRSR